MKTFKEKLKKIIKKLSQKRKFTLLGVMLLLLIGVSWGFFEPILSDIVKTKILAKSSTLDELIFTKGADIILEPRLDNLNVGMGNLSEETIVTAKLIANNNTNEATMNYSLYVDIKVNDYVYTTKEKTPELILTVIDSNGNEITEISGLTYYSDTNGLSGFDVTTKKGLIRVIENYEINASPTKTDEWTIKISMANLETNQSENAAKTFSGTIDLSKDVYPIRDLKFEVVNNKPVSSTYVPTAVQLSCDSGTATWNEIYKSVDIKGFNPETVCTLTKNNKTPGTKARDYIINLDASSADITNEGAAGYRYRGKTPNNYVSFNGEIWRIIGVIPTKTDNNDSENLVKIMRDRVIDDLAFDNSSPYNEWSDADINLLLNGAYLNSTDGTGTNCMGGSNIPAVCDYREIGIKSTYREMIEEVYYSVGYLSDKNQTASEAFTEERKRETKSKIGLINISDYVYSVVASCTANLGSYNSSACAGTSWMYGSGYMWTMTPYSSSGNPVVRVNISGSADYSNGGNGSAAQPVLYLKSTVEIISGDGSIESPYVLS